MVTEPREICTSQIFPFFYYQKQIAKRYGLQLRECTIEAFVEGRCPWIEKCDIVCLQTWFDMPKEKLDRALERIRTVCRPQRLVYFDPHAPVDVRLAKQLNPHIDLYVKKHVFKDRSRYGQPTKGETNLMEFYGERFGIEFPESTFEVPDGFLDKLIVGPSFATADYMMPRFVENHPYRRPKSLDLHARFGSRGEQWYAKMRSEAMDISRSIKGIRVAKGFGLKRKEFLNELAESKICFSPFGYGEVAWRDFEAIVCGALLLKPSMDHIETHPNIYVPGETYVPVKWDLSDVEEKVHYYAKHDEEREAITKAAFARLHEYFEAQQFLTQMRRVFEV